MGGVRRRLREALPVAMKARERVPVAELRSALAAIGNAEALEVDSPAGAVEASPVGVGAAEVDRRALSDADVVAIVRGEVAARVADARAYEAAGRVDRAELLRAEARVLSAFLPGGGS